MGGRGSGRRWHCGAKETTDDYRRLDVRRWQRDGLLEPGSAFGWKWARNDETIASINVMVEQGRVILSYRHRVGNEEWQDKNYPVNLAWISCPYGGSRTWFLCPAAHCGRRVAILYGGAIFACRHCYRLAYASQRERSDERALRKADNIRERLGWKPGVLNSKGRKPKGMHWHTYDRLIREHDALVEISLISVHDKK